MANYSTGSATGPGAVDAFFQIIVAAAITNGWTQHDILSTTTGSRDVVLRGAALDVTADVRPFVRMSQSSNELFFAGYSDWDPSAHAGMCQTGNLNSSAGISLQDASFSYVLFINSTSMCVAAKISGTWLHSYQGFLRRGLIPAKSGITKAPGTISSGDTSITVSSDMTTKLKVGQGVWIMNYNHNNGSANAENCEYVTLTSITSSVLGVTATVNNYDVNAVIGETVCPLLISSAGSGSTFIGSSWCPFNPDATRTGTTFQTATWTPDSFGLSTDLGPENGAAGQYGAGFIAVTGSASSHKGWRGFTYGYSCCVGGTQSVEDIMDDGNFTYLILGTSSLNITIGPREA